MISREEYLKRFKMTEKYQRCLNSIERKRMLSDANKLYDRRLAKKQRDEEFKKELELIQESYLKGYYDALNEIEMNEDLLASIGNRFGKMGDTADKVVDKVTPKFVKDKKREKASNNSSKKSSFTDKMVDPLVNYHTKKAVKEYTKKHGHAPSERVIEVYKNKQVRPATKKNLAGAAKVYAAGASIPVPAPTGSIGLGLGVGLGVADEIKKNRQKKEIAKKKSKKDWVLWIMMKFILKVIMMH